MSQPLPDRDAVRAEVTAALSGAVPNALLGGSYTAKAQANDLFEALLFATLLDEASRAGWSVRFEDPTEAPVTSLLLRVSPGSIVTPTAPFTHAVLERLGAMVLEVHVGVGVSGASGTTHEADLLVIPKFVAQYCRNYAVPPAVGKALLLAEAKYTAAATLPLGYGRGMLGLDRDLRGIAAGALVSARPNGNVTRLLERWDLTFVGDVIPAPGTFDDASLRAYFGKCLAKWQRSGADWSTAPKRRY